MKLVKAVIIIAAIITIYKYFHLEDLLDYIISPPSVDVNK